MSSTFTNTGTFTVTDIRKTFEGFSADFRMISIRTGKRKIEDVESLINDILIWAEAKYLDYVDLTLIDANKKPLKAVRYRVDENGKANQSDRAGNNNDWQNLPDTELKVVVGPNKKWGALSEKQRKDFMIVNNFRNSWGIVDFDIQYKHLTKDTAQVYASNGYELKKENFK